MADFQEEVYIIEKKEISEDEFEDDEFNQLQNEVENLEDFVNDDEDDDYDLNDFNALKAKTEAKITRRKEASLHQASLGASSKQFQQPKTTEKPVVIDDFIRNFFTQLKMSKTMNTFQQEWFEL